LAARPRRRTTTNAEKASVLTRAIAFPNEVPAATPSHSMIPMPSSATIIATR
jgi:hypothetical protein